jgi:hypothetical protein
MADERLSWDNTREQRLVFEKTVYHIAADVRGRRHAPIVP